MPPVMMVNMQLQKNVRTLQFITWVMAMVLIFDLVSFWAVWFWPIAIVFCGLYLVYLVARIAKYSGAYYGQQSWLMFCLLVLVFAGLVQGAIGIVLVVMEEDADDTRRAFQYISLVTGPVISITAFVWKTALERVLEAAYRATGGHFETSPTMRVAMDSRTMRDYEERNLSLGGARMTGSRGDYYERPAGSLEAITYNEDHQEVYDRVTQQDMFQRSEVGRPVVPPLISPPPIFSVNQQPPTADFYSYENDRRIGRPVLVTHTLPYYPTSDDRGTSSASNEVPARQYLRQQHLQQRARHPSTLSPETSKHMPAAFVPYGSAADSNYFSNDPFTIKSPLNARSPSKGLVKTPRTTEIAYDTEQPVFGRTNGEPFASPDARFPLGYQGARQGAPLSPNRRVSFAPTR